MRITFITILASFLMPMAWAQSIDYSKLSWIMIGGKNACIDPTGKVILKDRPRIFCGGILGFNKDGVEPYYANGLTGYRSVVTGDVLIPPQFKHAYEFHENGVARVSDPRSELFGLINLQGIYIIPPEYQWVSPFAKNGLAIARKDDRMGYIDKSNKAVIPFQYRKAIEFYEDGLASVEVDGLWRVINYKGEIVPGISSENALYFVNGLAVYRKGGLYGYIDAKGAVVIPPKYKEASNFHPTNGTAAVFDEGACRFIDRTGKRLDLPASRSMGGKLPESRPLCGGFESSGLARIQPIDQPDEISSYYYINRDGKIISNLILP